MRWLVCVAATSLLLVPGCERIKRGEPEIALSPAEVKGKPMPSVPKEVKPTQPETQKQERPPAPETPAPETPPTQTEAPEATVSPTTQPQPTPQPAAKPETAQPAAPAPVEAEASFADEARSVRASADALQSLFDKLSVSEIRSRLLLLNQSISELEVRSPALVLWRTALRLEVMSKSPYPDVAAARAWLARARNLLADQKVGLTALSNSETALKGGDWKGAVNALREAANKLKVSEQAEALTQARICLLNALDALERQKNSVAKAEVGEAVKALDRLVSALQ